ncbi:hypothetical protein TREES_T100008191 [Tupaia chinensis]|uniref:TASOR PIN domain-containing protein n=1 Tax=Tupaia chinensis TaxID=246437 RepID=L8YAP3_TUPCH|nr:hypothetical protein TREES_T100008191 [Tupaia chinensis]
MSALFTEKRRELKFDGRLEKELSESYAFLMVDRYQYYFYEYGFDELRRRPRHVCPYAVVSFTYKDDIQTPKYVPSSSPEKLDVETVMSIDLLKQKIPPALFYKETYLGPNEESSLPVGSLGHEADLRLQQQDSCNSGMADIHTLFNWLSETLANARHSDASLTDTVNKALGMSTEDAYEELRQQHEYELNSTPDKKEYEHPTCVKIENAHFKGTQVPLLEVNPASLKYSVAVSTNEVGADLKLHLKEDPNLISVNNFEDCSLCPTVPIEHGFCKQQSKSNDVEETEIHWKLIPITGMKSPEEQLVCLPPQKAFPNDPRVISRQRSSDHQFPSSPFTDTLKGTPEEDVLTGQVVTVEEQCMPAAEPPAVSEATERTVLGEYHLFSRKIEEILKQKNVSYVSRISAPIFSTQEKIKRLSEFVYCNSSKAGVQEFVDGLHEKLNTVIIKASAKGRNQPAVSPSDSGTKITSSPLGTNVTPRSSSDLDSRHLGPLSSDSLKDTNSNEQHSSSALGLTEVEMNQPHHASMVTLDPTLPGDVPQEPGEKETKSPGDVNISAQPALSNFISQLEPEVFNSLVKIMKDVQKNTVKFYIHEEEESMLCKEIKKKHLVEILSYHNCDSQTRKAPELDCLIRLQAQNIHQRHIVFLTEKNTKMVSCYADNGIVVATAEDFMQNFKNLVGYHNSITEENLPLIGANETLESQSGYPFLLLLLQPYHNCDVSVRKADVLT